MATPVRELVPVSRPSADVPVGSTPVQSIAMALLQEHNLINSANASPVTKYWTLQNHLSWELPMIAAELAPWRERHRHDEWGIPPDETRKLRARALRIREELKARKPALEIAFETKPVGGYPPRYLLKAGPPKRLAGMVPIIIYGADVERVLPTKVEVARDAVFDEAIIDLFGRHFEVHELAADAGLLNLGTQVSNLRGYSKSDQQGELNETVNAREEGARVTGISAFSEPPVGAKAEPEAEEFDVDEPDDER
jgi:hypothetical protein